MGTVALLALALVIGVGAGTMFWRRRSADSVTAANLELAQAREELQLSVRSSKAAREVRDLILSSMQDGILLLDPNGSTAYANPALATLLGSRPEGLRSLVPLAVRSIATDAAEHGSSGSTIVEVGFPSRSLRVQAVPAGGDGSVLLVMHDVTEARHLDATRRDFVANASHELKTPIASIRAAAETLRDGAIDDPPAAARFTEQLEREAQRLSRIVSDLLDLSRLEGGSELLDRVRIDAVTRDEAERLDDRAIDAEITLTVDASPVPPILGSGRDLALLVRNLVDNAIRYTPVGGSVDVSVGSDGSDIILRVADTGIGIPSRDIPRIFERFYRVDRARSRDTGGTGLGLSIVRHITENHGGEVTVASELGQGTVFEVRLPTAAAAP
jgi:signal transduction histidine kinase